MIIPMKRPQPDAGCRAVE